jgi:hypothetical protein
MIALMEFEPGSARLRNIYSTKALDQNLCRILKHRCAVRRIFGSATIVPCAALAQTPFRVYRLGSINPALPLAPQSPFGKILVDALAERGYVKRMCP